MKVIDCEQNTPEWFMARAGVPTASCFGKVFCAQMSEKKLTNSNKGKSGFYLISSDGSEIKADKLNSFAGDKDLISTADLKSHVVEAEPLGKYYEVKPGDTLIVRGGLKPSDQQDGYIGDLIDQSHQIAPDQWVGTRAMREGLEIEPEARSYYEFYNDTEVEQVGFVTTDDGRFGCSPDGFIDGGRGGLELKFPAGSTHAQWLWTGGLPLKHKCQVHGCMYVTGCRYWDFMSYAEAYKPLIVRVKWDGFTDKIGPALDKFYTRYQQAKERVAE